MPAGRLRSQSTFSGLTPSRPVPTSCWWGPAQNGFANVLTAEDYAKNHGQYVSSRGGSESSGEAANNSHFVQSGVSFFVSAGYASLPTEYPSASPNVISVGGTTLHFSGITFTGETGWSGGGGGCSAY